MPEDSLPPLKRAGGVGYVFAAALMLALMIGLILWRVRSVPAPLPSLPSTTVRETTAPLAHPVPPPPSAVAAAASASARPRSVGGAVLAAGCGTEDCDGKLGGELRAALQAKAGQARTCYQTGLRARPNLRGKLDVSLRIGSGGQVCSAAVRVDQLADPGVTGCVMNLFRAAAFPAPLGGCVEVVVPMNFVPKP